MEPDVTALFSRGRRRSTRLAVEHELLAADAATGRAVAPQRVRAAVAGTAYERWVSLEPGGQVELSLPSVEGPAELADALRATVAALAADLARAGVVLHALPVDPRPVTALPLALTSARYTAMQAHLDTIGPAGRRMMRATASTQLCLDWWPGRAGLEQWRVLLLVAPFLAAATARATGPASRLATWLEVDPARTAFDGRLLHGDDPVAAYAAFAAGATAFVDGGPAEHLSTLFPPVRPRGRYLEVRWPDVQPADRVAPLAAALATLVYDDTARARALAALAPEAHRLDAHWQAAAQGCPATAERGRALLAGAEAHARGDHRGAA